MVLPVVWQLKKRPMFQPKLLPAFSALIALAGAYWLIERVVSLGR